MKTIKLKFVGFWDGYDPKDSILFKLLSNEYDFVICDDPDYVICSCFGEPYSYLKYPQVRIMVCGENYTPDFNFIDYAIGRYPIHFLNRYFYEPGCLRPYPDCMKLENFPKVDKLFLKEKTEFCSFVASHESEHNIRGDFFKKLCNYKKVSSVGSYLNNTGIYVSRNDGSKLGFNKKCKFALCFESTKSEGFITEKMNEAFLARAIPIYYGSSTCTNIYNPKAFINVSDFETFEDAINYIKQVDQDDDLFLSMVNEPVFNKANYLTNLVEEEIAFLRNIFDQPMETAYRRSRVYWPKDHEKRILLWKTKKDNSSFIKKLKRFVRNKNQ